MRKILIRATLILLLVGTCFAGWVYRARIVALVETAIVSSTASDPAPDPETYSVLSESLEEHRRRLSADYLRTTSNTERSCTYSHNIQRSDFILRIVDILE